MNKKFNLRKINKANNSTVRILACHCGCEGKPWSAVGDGYLGQFL
ncbi:lachnocin family radical SAM-modified peptide [Luxibacter massiliensis]|nr:lachnocin family radical SAM-modified peptide [Luxibacter massiliensis]